MAMSMMNTMQHEQHEQHSHDEQEQHSEECDTCIILSKLSDPIHFAPDVYKGRFIAEQNYFFILRNIFTTATTLVNPRAPPQEYTPI